MPGPMQSLIRGAAFVLAMTPGVVAAEDVFVSGLAPDRRPDGAPKIMVTVHPQAWYVRALTGVVPPYPRSLYFLDDQGDWFTPFNRPGLTGRYDIRGWYAAK